MLQGQRLSRHLLVFDLIDGQLLDFDFLFLAALLLPISEVHIVVLDPGRRGLDLRLGPSSLESQLRHERLLLACGAPTALRPRVEQVLSYHKLPGLTRERHLSRRRRLLCR